MNTIEIYDSLNDEFITITTAKETNKTIQEDRYDPLYDEFTGGHQDARNIST